MPRSCLQCGREIPSIIHKSRKTCSDRCRLRRNKALSKRGRDYGERLPVAPWIAWLEAEQARRDVSIHVFASQLGVHENKLSAWLCGRFQEIHLDTVDRALCEAGEPMALREIYPELYELTEVAA